MENEENKINALPRCCRDCPNLIPQGVDSQAGWGCTVLRKVRDDCFVIKLKRRHETEKQYALLAA